MSSIIKTESTSTQKTEFRGAGGIEGPGEFTYRHFNVRAIIDKSQHRKMDCHE
jgi:hypothetical protein